MPKKPIFADRAPRSRAGKPPDHPPVKVWETGQIFETYSEAGESVGCTRWGVMRCCKGVQDNSHGFHFLYDPDAEGFEDWRNHGHFLEDDLWWMR